jgi:hypothetical protein
MSEEACSLIFYPCNEKHQRCKPSAGVQSPCGLLHAQELLQVQPFSAHLERRRKKANSKSYYTAIEQ